MTTLFSESLTFAVVFKPVCRREKHWIASFLHPEFGHCYLIRDTGKGAVVIDPLAWGIATQIEDAAFDDVVLAHAADATAVVLYVADYRFNTYAIGRLFYSCVSVCKAVLGLRRGRLVQTPKQLYKYLLRQPGASVIKPWSPWMGEKK